MFYKSILQTSFSTFAVFDTIILKLINKKDLKMLNFFFIFSPFLITIQKKIYINTQHIHNRQNNNYYKISIDILHFSIENIATTYALFKQIQIVTLYTYLIMIHEMLYLHNNRIYRYILSNKIAKLHFHKIHEFI